MRDTEAKITGAVLAGGLSRRMGGRDKALIPFRGRPLIHYALKALQSVTDTIIINANRNQGVYRQMGYPVVSDHTDTFDGPLAGILSVMGAAETAYVMTAPCDSPMIDGALLLHLFDTLQSAQADVCVAHDGRRLHPVFLVLKVELADSLERYLAGGGRKIDDWLFQQKLAVADCSAWAQMFRNINTLEELTELEAEYHG